MTADDTGPGAVASDVTESAASGSAPVPGGGDPLHGVTLEAMLQSLVGRLGWEGLAEKIPARCFSSDPSVASSLKFLRKTPWAREKLELLYLYVLYPAEAARRAKARRAKEGPSRKGPPKAGGPRKGDRGSEPSRRRRSSPS